MMRFRPVGGDAWLVELDDLAHTLALSAALRSRQIDGVQECVTAARTVLVRHRPSRIAADALIARIRACAAEVGADGIRSAATQGVPDGDQPGAGAPIEIPVRYDGEDLEPVARRLQVSTAELVRRHTGREWTMAFAGFAPGFAYLSSGTDTGLAVSRHATPRLRIAPGAVGLAGDFSCVYPQASPGGWQIIGHTSLAMWDLSRERPALLQPGDRVRFVDVSTRPRGHAAVPAQAEVSAPASAAAPQADACDGPALRVVQPGVQALFQDGGRAGQSAQGVSMSGATDRAAWRQANRLVGHVEPGAVIELAYGGFVFDCVGDLVVAFTGAPAPIERRSASGLRQAIRTHAAVALRDGDRVTVGAPRAGCRTYLAVRGGFAAAPVLGSCATDTLARLGPPAIGAGDRLPVRPVTRGAIVGPPESPPPDLPTPSSDVVLDVLMGPRTDWFSIDAVARLADQCWTVTPSSDRVGLRLSGEQPLARAVHDELPSEATVRGALQVPPSGQPVLFLADHPLTGGYPVIAVVAPHHLDRAGQIPIGARVRFNPISTFGVR